MKYRSKNGFEGTFEMCEMLTYCKEGNPPKKRYVYTPDGCAHKYPQFLESQITNTDLFEPIEERVELEFRDIHRLSINSKDGSSFSDEDLKLMEQAINGEMFHKKSIKAIMKYAVKRAAFVLGEGCVDYNWVKDWLKDKQSK